jgi:(5-formylfuran-3-yl)methyl phosphate synthase
MRLLVSVRGADEVSAALAGGADIVDAKEPAHGPLGPVPPRVLRAIAARVPGSLPFSVALGDFTATDRVRRAVAGVDLPERRGPLYLKLGFAGQGSAREVTSLITAAIASTAASIDQAVVVPVAYADHIRACTPSPEALLMAAEKAGARAFLMDTYSKDGRSLLDWVGLDRLRTLAANARSAGVLFALAGSLGLGALDRIRGIADVVGVRGAACRGGRGGSVDAALVRRLKDQLRVAQDLGVAVA